MEDNIRFLIQKINSIEELSKKFEDFFDEQNILKFNQAKREMIEIQNAILEMLGEEHN